MNSGLFHGIKFRLVCWFSISLFVSVIVACGTIYFLLSTSLRKSDRILIENQSSTFKKVIESKYREEELLELTHKEPELYVTIIRNDGSPKFTHLPEDVRDKEEIAHVIRQTRSKIKPGWKIILLEGGEDQIDMETRFQSFLLKKKFKELVYFLEDDIFESYTSSLSSGDWLVVGKSAEKREKGLTKIRVITYMVVLPFFLVGILLSFLLARKLLKPIKEMILTIDDIERGGLESRVKIHGTNDEIDQLAVRFNGLLNSNQKLISNLKGTLDNVAHDLKTPITRLINFAEEALRKETTSTEKLQEALGQAIENGEKIVKLLNAIMDLTEAETGTMNLKYEDIELHDLIVQAIDLYQMVAEDRGISISLTGETTCTVKGDRVRIAQAITNLLDNAIKYSSNDSEVRVSLKSDQQMAIIMFHDSGRGIDTDEQSKIWERLYRVDHSRSTPGMGIGLSVVRAIAIAHKGHVSVESSIGKGSKFSFELPINHA